ncbi:MAG: hypothetical protein PHU85_03910 [Phycisphaerae bacterium]|nr:hypothetical protein [Phycisphaerae bacterium]
MIRHARLGCFAVIVLLLVGCQSADEQLYRKWQQAGNGTYKGPAVASSTENIAGQTPPDRTKRYHPEMYYGYSTYNTPMFTNRDDSIVGTFRVPVPSGPGAVGFQPGVSQAVRGASLGVRSSVVPAGENPPNR